LQPNPRTVPAFFFESHPRARLPDGMHFSLSLDHPDTLVVHLLEGTEATSVSVHPAAAGATSLLRALVTSEIDRLGLRRAS
jgi:hypothetical protein